MHKLFLDFLLCQVQPTRSVKNLAIPDSFARFAGLDSFFRGMFYNFASNCH